MESSFGIGPLLVLLIPFCSTEEIVGNRFAEQPVIDVSIPPGYRLVGDMLLSEDLLESLNDTRNAVPSPGRLWPNGRVPYYIDNSLSYYTNKIQQAMAEYHRTTCIRFVQAGNNDRNYVHLFSGQGCYSMVGNQRYGSQQLSLGQGCLDHGTIVHELGHAIGFYHEHMRSDRDNHINIHWQNIQQGMQSQFQKMYPNEHWLINNFDVNSVMLYGELAFSKDGRSLTMSHKFGQKLYEVYQKRGMSNADIQRVNKLYGC